ncbi:hypothetical protein PDE_03461 [Penicillium oxalicum 114-2]|uniref:Secreted protein n=1 Tax=Penicillium oxalicum (strain 114-2 / CGMCC 5302) TaxID=933388 RepID=S7ZCZ8_PENO1|nr:hypothetical protein PDE_03461 [Penicillium oxalicum 114-2]
MPLSVTATARCGPMWLWILTVCFAEVHCTCAIYQPPEKFRVRCITDGSPEDFHLVTSSIQSWFKRV